MTYRVLHPARVGATLLFTLLVGVSFPERASAEDEKPAPASAPVVSIDSTRPFTVIVTASPASTRARTRRVSFRSSREATSLMRLQNRHHPVVTRKR